jgi:hypothetical protein
MGLRMAGGGVNKHDKEVLNSLDAEKTAALWLRFSRGGVILRDTSNGRDKRFIKLLKKLRTIYQQR